MEDGALMESLLGLSPELLSGLTECSFQFKLDRLSTLMWVVFKIVSSFIEGK